MSTSARLVSLLCTHSVNRTWVLSVHESCPTECGRGSSNSGSSSGVVVAVVVFPLSRRKRS